MIRLLLLLAIASGLGIQDDPAADLVRRLGADSPAERDEAEAALRELGPRAKAALCAGVASDDPEVRVRSGKLLEAVRAVEEVQKQEAVQRREKLGLDLPAAEASLRVPGAAFRVSRRPWPAEGDPEGWIFETQVSGPAALVDWDAELHGGVDASESERCLRHGPGLQLLRRPEVAGASLRIHGTAWWLCDHEFTWERPGEGESRRHAGVEFRLEAGVVQVKLPAPVPGALAERIFASTDLFVELSPDAEIIVYGKSSSGRFGRAFRRANPEPPDWCGCPGRAIPGPWAPLPTVQTWGVSLPVPNRAPDIVRMRVRFHRPVAEPFDAFTRDLLP